MAKKINRSISGSEFDSFLNTYTEMITPKINMDSPDFGSPYKPEPRQPAQPSITEAFTGSMGQFRQLEGNTRLPVPGLDFDAPATAPSDRANFDPENEWQQETYAIPQNSKTAQVMNPFVRAAAQVTSDAGGLLRMVGAEETGKAVADHYKGVADSIPQSEGERLNAAKPFEFSDMANPEAWTNGQVVASFMSAAGSSAPFIVGSIISAALMPASVTAGATALTSAAAARIGAQALSTAAGRATIGKLMANPTFQKMASSKLGEFGKAYTISRAASAIPEAGVEGGGSYNAMAEWNDAVGVLRDPNANLDMKASAKAAIAKMHEQAGGKPGTIDFDHVPSIDDAKFRAWKQTMANIPLLVTSNALEGVNLFSPSKGIVKGGLRKAGFGALQNGGEEFFQAAAANGVDGMGTKGTPVQDDQFVWSANPANWSPNTKAAVFGGALFGGVMGAAGGGANVQPQNNNPVVDPNAAPVPTAAPQSGIKIGDVVPDDQYGPVTFTGVTPEGKAAFTTQDGTEIQMNVPKNMIDQSVFENQQNSPGALPLGPEPTGLVANPGAKAPEANEIKPSESFIKPEKHEVDAAPTSPPNKNWQIDPGAIPGEAEMFLVAQGVDFDDAKAAIRQVVDDQGKALWEAALPSGDSLGQFTTVAEAAAAAEKAVVGVKQTIPMNNQENIPSTIPVVESPSEAQAFDKNSFAVGDNISWNGGDKSGTIAKITKTGIAVKKPDGTATTITWKNAPVLGITKNNSQEVAVGIDDQISPVAAAPVTSDQTADDERHYQEWKADREKAIARDKQEAADGVKRGSGMLSQQEISDMMGSKGYIERYEKEAAPASPVETQRPQTEEEAEKKIAHNKKYAAVGSEITYMKGGAAATGFIVGINGNKVEIGDSPKEAATTRRDMDRITIKGHEYGAAKPVSEPATEESQAEVDKVLSEKPVTVADVEKAKNDQYFAPRSETYKPRDPKTPAETKYRQAIGYQKADPEKQQLYDMNYDTIDKALRLDDNYAKYVHLRDSFISNDNHRYMAAYDAITGEKIPRKQGERLQYLQDKYPEEHKKLMAARETKRAASESESRRRRINGKRVIHEGTEMGRADFIDAAIDGGYAHTVRRPRGAAFVYHLMGDHGKGYILSNKEEFLYASEKIDAINDAAIPDDPEVDALFEKPAKAPEAKPAPEKPVPTPEEAAAILKKNEDVMQRPHGSGTIDLDKLKVLDEAGPNHPYKIAEAKRKELQSKFDRFVKKEYTMTSDEFAEGLKIDVIPHGFYKQLREQYPLSRAEHNAKVEDDTILDYYIQKYLDAADAPIANSPELSDNGVENTEFADSRLAAVKEEIKSHRKLKQPVNVVDSSADAIAATEKALFDELNNLSANPVFNPKVLSLTLKLGLQHAQNGVNDFADWSAKMIASAKEASDKIKPYLESTWAMINNYPAGEKFNDGLVNALFEYTGIQHQRGVTGKDALSQKITDDLGEEFEPYVKMAYEGITSWKGGSDNGINGGQSEVRPVDKGRGEDIHETVGGRRAGKPTGNKNDSVLGAQSAQNAQTAEGVGDAGADGIRPLQQVGGRGGDVSENGDVLPGRPQSSANGVVSEGTGAGSAGPAGNGRGGQPSGTVREDAGGVSEPAKGTFNVGDRVYWRDKDKTPWSGDIVSFKTEKGVQYAVLDVDEKRPKSVPVADLKPNASGVGLHDPSDSKKPDVSPEIKENQRPNYHIDNPEQLIGGTPKVRFARNKAALEAFLSVSVEDRVPTKEDLDAMASYIGWGSFGQELFQGNWATPQPKEGWTKEDAWLREHLGKEEWESAQRSIINAHYTDPVTVKAMWDIVQKMGFRGGRVLEPSMGVGNFFGLMPLSVMENSQLTGIELDKLTGGMAKLLYPNANIQIKGYQDSQTADNFYDMVIGNFPFASQSPADRRYMSLSPTLHDFFYLKGLDQVRPGGLVVAITSAGTMDKTGKSVRIELAKKAELVASYRLPSGAFEKYAGTSVVTDVLVFKKREIPLTDISGETWINTDETKVPHGKVKINQYYIDNPDHVLGTLDYGHGTTSGRPGMIVNRPANLQEMVETLSDRFAEGTYSHVQPHHNLSYVSNNIGDRHGSVVVDSKGNLMVSLGDVMAPANEVKRYAIKNEKDTQSREDQIKRLVGIRKAYGATIDAERANEPETEALRKSLKQMYLDFVGKHGAVEKSYGLKYLQNIGDPFAPLLKALERDGKPADVLDKRTVRSIKNIDKPTIEEAFVIARNQSMFVDLSVVAKAANTTETEVAKKLIDLGQIIKTPAGNYETTDQYLSGNVRVKMIQAKDALAAGDADMQVNIDALTLVMPETIPYYKIEARLGAPWVGMDNYHSFVAELLGVKTNEGFDVSNVGGSYKVDFSDRALNRRTEATNLNGVTFYPFDKLITHAFNNTAIVIKYTDPDTKAVTILEDESAQANEKVAQVRELFTQWVWKDSSRKIQLENNYNNVMNAIASPKYNGSFLQFPGMALLRGENEFSLRQHQINAIWRGLANNRGIYGHEVGTGKTFTMVGIAVESRRLGIARKPILFAHNSNSASVAADANVMYPGAKVLYIESLGKNNVKTELHRIANEDWDLVIVPHSLIDNFCLSEQTLMSIAADEISNLEDAAIAAAQEDNVELDLKMMDDADAIKSLRSYTAKDLVKQRNKIIEKIKLQALEATKEGAITFENLGIDQILVDEAHIFKKPPLATKMKMKGLATSTSDRSLSLYFLTQYVKQKNNGAGVHLFTGTPITNSLVEIYNMMRYVMDSDMRKTGVESWDAWFASFADSDTDVELTSTGEYEPVTRLSQFVNTAELRQMAGQYMDIVFADEMPEFKPRETSTGKTVADELTPEEKDELHNGRSENPKGRPYKKIINDFSDMTPPQRTILELLVKRATTFKQASKKERNDIMKGGRPESPVIVETDASNAGVDARLFDMTAKDYKESKVNRVVSNVLEIYKGSPVTTQVIFMQRGLSDFKTKTVRDGAGNKHEIKLPALNLSKEIVAKLVSEGIPKEQIAIVNGSTSKEKRKEISDDMNRAKIRVVIGTTETLGVGVNMQENLRALHHVDAPWMPGDLEQRNGRGHRQGNKWNTVLEYRYLTNKLDGRRWQVLAIKARFIKAFLTADKSVRIIDGDAVSLDETDDISATMAEATGDPRRMQANKLKNDVTKLERRERNYLYGMSDAQDKINELKGSTKRAKEAVTHAKTDIGSLEKFKDAEFSFKFGESVLVDKEVVAAMIQDAAKEVTADRNLDGGQRQYFGEYKGFRLYFVKSYFASSAPSVEVQGAGTYGANPSIGSIDHSLRAIKNVIVIGNQTLSDNAESITKLQKMLTEPFYQQDALDRKKKQLSNLEADLLRNPNPLPGWVGDTAPVGSEVYVNGRPHVVEGHKEINGEYWVIADGSVYMASEVNDENGMPLYEQLQTRKPDAVNAWRSMANSDAAKAEGSYLYSGVDPFTLIPGLRKYKDMTAKEAFRDLVTIGRKVYENGVTNGGKWIAEMKKLLGIQWAKAKPTIMKVWAEVKKVISNNRGEVRAWHGTPHEVDKFSSSKIGTGEGVQAYGHGLYFSSKQEIAEWYRDELSSSDIDNDTFAVIADSAIELFEDGSQSEIRNNLLSMKRDYKRNEEDGLGELLGILADDPAFVRTMSDYALKHNADPNKNTRDVSDAVKSLNKELIGMIRKVAKENNIVKDGHLYEVSLAPDEADFLDWDAPLSQQSEKVKSALEKAGVKKTEWEVRYGVTGKFINGTVWGVFQDGQRVSVAATKEKALADMEDNRRYSKQTGNRIYESVTQNQGSTKKASQYLLSHGIPGIKYNGRTSRETNYVVFDDSHIDIKAVDLVPVLQKYTDANAKDAMGDLVKLGTAVLKENRGSVNSSMFVNRMKELLGSMWSRFRPYMAKVWAAVKNTLSNNRGAIRLGGQRIEADTVIVPSGTQEGGKKTVDQLVANGWIAKKSQGATVLTRPEAKPKEVPADFKPVIPGMDRSVAYELEQSSKLPKIPTVETVKDGMKNMWAYMSRKYRALPRTAQFSPLEFALTTLEHKRGVATDTAVKIINNITNPLKDSKDYKVFSLKVVFDDIAADLAEDENYAMPFGLTKENFQEQHDLVTAAVTPNVQKAIDARKAAWTDFKEKYMKAMRAVGFDPKLTKGDTYFHHIVIDYAELKERMDPTLGAKLRTPNYRGFLKERGGSTKNILTDYLQPEIEVMGQMMYDIEIAKVIKLVADKYDILSDLKRIAVTTNEGNMIQDLIDEFGAEQGVKEWGKLSKKQAMAMGFLGKAAYNDDLPNGNGKYDDLIQRLAENHENNLESEPEDRTQADISKNELFAYLNYLIKQNDSIEGKQIAGLMFKGLAEKARAIKDRLGEEHLSWRDLVPEGYDIYQPREGNIFYTGYSIPEHIAQAFADKAMEQLGVSQDQIKRVLLQGGKRREMVVPVEVSATLADIAPAKKHQGMIMNIIDAGMNLWKQGVLQMPNRILAYNFNNGIGDLDAAIAGQGTGAANYAKTAAIELYGVFYKGKEMSPMMKEWFERGGFETLLQAQEAGKISSLAYFDRFLEKEDGNLKKLASVPKQVYSAYWRGARKATDFREAIMRYAKFLDYVDQMEGPPNQMPQEFGASEPSHVMALDDKYDRAFKLSNELMGAYDSISEFGQDMRRHFWAFWSWKEVNATRYLQMLKNNTKDSKTLADIAFAVGGTAIRKAPFAALRLGAFALKATAMMSLLGAYNWYYWPEEEKELEETVRYKAHIILGRDSDGKVRYIKANGAFADLMGWIGMDTPFEHVDAYLSGRKTLAQIGRDMLWAIPNNVVSGVTPFIKTPAEMLYGKTVYPDMRKPRPIRDRGQYLAQSIALGEEYKAVFGLPGRPYSPANWGIVRQSDPMRAGYYDIMDRKQEWLNSKGKGSEGGYTSKKSEALRYYKEALRYQDEQAAVKYLEEYKLAGGTREGLERSLESMNPVSGMKKTDRKEFIETLAPEDRAKLERAQQYFDLVISRSGGTLKVTKKGVIDVKLKDVDLPTEKKPKKTTNKFF